MSLVIIIAHILGICVGLFLYELVRVVIYVVHDIIAAYKMKLVKVRRIDYERIINKD